jgi:L-fuculose-phosphate aldolase
MEISQNYVALFNEYLKRMAEEGLLVGDCSLSVKIAADAFLFCQSKGKKEIAQSDITTISLFGKTGERSAELHKLAYLHGKDARAVVHAFPQNAAAVGEAGTDIPPLLDDMAQIVGPTAKCAQNDNKSVAKVLKKRAACIIRGAGALTYGRSLDEAYTACLVLEKAAKCLIDTTVIGQSKKINPIEARLMHLVYKKKYSKQNQKSKENPAVIKSEKQGEGKFSEKELKIRKEIKEAGVRLLNSNLVQGTWGNISARIGDTHMLITPTGMDYLSMGVEDIVLVDLETMEYKGLHKPSGEKGIHAGLLKSRKDINVVMHSHPPECSALAAARCGLPAEIGEMQKYVGGDAKVADYALPGTKALSKATIKAMEGRNACLMANHGMLAVGETFEEAFSTCRVMEQSARAFIDKKSAELSGLSNPAARRREIFLSRRQRNK